MNKINQFRTRYFLLSTLVSRLPAPCYLKTLRVLGITSQMDNLKNSKEFVSCFKLDGLLGQVTSIRVHSREARMVGSPKTVSLQFFFGGY